MRYVHYIKLHDVKKLQMPFGIAKIRYYQTFDVKIKTIFRFLFFFRKCKHNYNKFLESLPTTGYYGGPVNWNRISLADGVKTVIKVKQGGRGEYFGGLVCFFGNARRIHYDRFRKPIRKINT